MACSTRRSVFCGRPGAAAARTGLRAMGVASKMPVVRTAVGKIVVIGGGALGSLFSGRLAALKELDERVWMLTNWAEHANIVNKMGGLVVRESDAVGGGCLVGNVQVTNDFRTILNEKTPDEDKLIYNVNVVIVAVKQRSIRRAAEEAAKLLSKSHGGVCISLLNGVGHMPVLQDAFRYHDTKASLIHGVFNGGAAMECPGVVVHTGRGSTQLGEDATADLMSRNFLHDVADLLSRAGLAAQLRGDVLGVVWQKLAVNAAINPLTAILRVKNGALPLSPACVELMEGAAREAHEVGCKVLEESMGKEAAAQTQLVWGRARTPCLLAARGARTWEAAGALLPVMLKPL